MHIYVYLCVCVCLCVIVLGQGENMQCPQGFSAVSQNFGRTLTNTLALREEKT